MDDQHQLPPAHHHHHHRATPLHPSSPCITTAVRCDRCRPSSHEKPSVVPLNASPSGVIRSIFHSLTHRTPRSSASTPDWKLAAADLSRKLLRATRRRDEAILEADRLRAAVADLQRKFCRLESAVGYPPPSSSPAANAAALLDPFLHAVSESRSAVHQLARAALPPHRRSMIIQLEAHLNRIFYSGFESGFGLDESAPLDPVERCESNRAAYEAIHGVGWDQVLARGGTRHFSRELSRFCDRRMGEVAALMGWTKTWPEHLLQAFFGAAKGVWQVGLLARSVHPPVPLLRVGIGVGFDEVYIEDAAPTNGLTLRPATVRVVVAPGFYVYNATSCGVIKSRVLCTYTGSTNAHAAHTPTFVSP